MYKRKLKQKLFNLSGFSVTSYMYAVYELWQMRIQTFAATL